MKLTPPTDIDPRLAQGNPRPDQATATPPLPAPTLQDFGVP